MIRQITVTVMYDIPEEFVSSITPTDKAEDFTTRAMQMDFAEDEFYQGLRVDVKDFEDVERTRKLKQFIGIY